jgi:hypothetical protein
MSSKKTLPRLGGWPLSGAALTQHFPDISDGENAKKAPDTRTNLKLGPCVFVELRHFINRHLRLLGQELDGSLLMGSFAVISGHSNPQDTAHVLGDTVRWRS